MSKEKLIFTFIMYIQTIKESGYKFNLAAMSDKRFYLILIQKINRSFNSNY